MVRSCRLSYEVSESFETEYREERRRPFDEFINLEGIDLKRQERKAKRSRRKQIPSPPLVPFVAKPLPPRGRLL